MIRAKKFVGLMVCFGLGAGLCIHDHAPAVASTEGHPARPTAAGPTAAAAPSNPAPLNARAISAYRHNLMEAIGKHLKLLTMITKGEVPFADQALMHAEEIEALCKTIPTLFPRGTEPDKVKGDAKAEIWTQWEKFLEHSKKQDEANAALVTAARTGNLSSMAEAQRATGKACGACHDLYRVEE